MKVKYSVSFEFKVNPPVTHRGMVEGSTSATCVARATREAQKALRPVAWTSMVCTLLERIGEEIEESEPEAVESLA